MYKIAQPLVGHVAGFFATYMHLPFDIEILLLKIYLKGIKIYVKINKFTTISYQSLS